MMIVFILSMLICYGIVNRGCGFLDTFSLERSKINKLTGKEKTCYNYLHETMNETELQESEEENQYECIRERTYSDLPVFFTFECEDYQDSWRIGEGISRHVDGIVCGNTGLSLYAGSGSGKA